MSQEDIDRFVARLFDKDPPTVRPDTLPLPYSNGNHPPLVRIIVLLLTFFLQLTHPLCPTVTEGIDDLDILDIRNSIPSIAEMFHVVLETLIMLLSDGLQGLCCRWMLVRAPKVPSEHGTQLVP
jgi:hypothetical protein